MFTTNDAIQLRRGISDARKLGCEIALVPTMGALHEGHASLVRIAKARGCFVVMTIFVNPLQFNNPEDLKKYPRTLERDQEIAQSCGVDLLFNPSAEQIYSRPPDRSAVDTGGCVIAAGGLSRVLDGPARPGHFDGVVTVVGIIFNIVQPDCAVFGEKDFQQVRVIKQMTRDLHFPIEIIAAPIVREPDGLAMSSRNVRLAPDQRTRALEIPKALRFAESLVASGERNAGTVISAVKNRFEAPVSLNVDYVSIVDSESLQAVVEINSNSRILIAVFVGEVRLIDNAALM